MDFNNGRVFTGRAADGWVSGIAVRDGIVTSLSADGAGARDLAGRSVVPGMLDIHAHPSYLATLSGMVDLRPPVVRDKASLLQAFRNHPRFGTGPEGVGGGGRLGRLRLSGRALHTR